jgi:hypothetical protein
MFHTPWWLGTLSTLPQAPEVCNGGQQLPFLYSR